ncbi:MAG: LysR family transcriptional regulator [Qingshengfaniella sp.]
MDLNALREFSAIATEGSFVGAARRLGTPKSTVSKRIQDLEADLGVTLIQRTTRRLKLTEEGTLLLARAERILADAAEIETILSGETEAIRGHLRLAVPTLIGDIFMGRIAALCRQLYPDLGLEIVTSDGQPDLVEEGFDGALRFGPMLDDRYLAVPLAISPSVCVVAPQLLNAPCPHPRDLAKLPVLIYGVGLIQSWYFERTGDTASVRLAATMAATSHHALRDAALGGAGVALLPHFLVEQDLAKGRLTLALDGWAPPPAEVLFVHPDAQTLSARLRALRDLLIKTFAHGTLHGSALNL